jgi:hypothetical protein
LNTLVAFRTLNTLLALNALMPFLALRTLNALRASVANHTLWTSRSRKALRSGWTLGTGRSRHIDIGSESANAVDRDDKAHYAGTVEESLGVTFGLIRSVTRPE